jgi:hypothetical protein
MRNLILASASAGFIFFGAVSAHAQAPPKGTSYADCRVNPDWRWFGYKTTAGGWKGYCVRKVMKVVKDGAKKTKTALDKVKVKTKKSGDGGGS